MEEEPVTPKLTKTGKVRKPMTPEALEKLKNARKVASDLYQERLLQRTEAKLNKLKTKQQEKQDAKEEKEDLEKPEEKPEDNEVEEDTSTLIPDEPIEEAKVEPKKEKKKKKQPKVIVEQSSDDSDEFHPNDNVIFVKRVSRKKKETKEETREDGYPGSPIKQRPPEHTAPQIVRPQLSKEELLLKQNYDAMFSGNFLRQRRGF